MVSTRSFGTALLLVGAAAPLAWGATRQNFDTPGTAYQMAPQCGGPGAAILTGGSRGQFLRLAHAAPQPVPNCNTIGFARSDPGPASHVVADFRFRLTRAAPPFDHRADGLGFALLNTDHYGLAGAQNPVDPLSAHEEPNFEKSLGVGFDIHWETARLPEEPSNNHISIHYDRQFITAIHVRGLDLASGGWIHARIVMRPGNGFSDVSVALTALDPPGATFQTYKVHVPGLVPYEGRAHFGARSGGQSADHDLDDVSLEFLPASVQDFDDGGGTAYAAESQADCNPPGPTLFEEAPRGRFLRLAREAPPIPNCNTVALARDVPGLYTRVEAEFDFRMAWQGSRGDGLGFALLNTAEYGFAGPASPLAVSEEPNFRGSVGVGFDIHQAAGEPSDNHVSVHFDNVLVAAWPVATLDLAGGQWIHARITIEMGAAPSVAVRLTSGAAIFEEAAALPALKPYEGRLLLGARSGGSAANHDVDDLRARFSGEPDPAVYGRWSPLVRWPTIPIHMHLLPTGQVMFWDRHSDRHHGGGVRIYEDDRDGDPRLWDYRTGRITQPPAPHYDIFCSGHSFLADGKLLISGGHLRDNVGLPHAILYDPFPKPPPLGDPWQMLPEMSAGRWYPTNTTLADGSVLVVSGDIGAGQVNDLPEVFHPAAGEWERLENARRPLPLYPWTYLAPDGRVFAAGPHPDARFLDLKAQAWSGAAMSRFPFRDVGTSVLYDTGKVLIVGGNFEGQAPYKLAESIDLRAVPLRWQEAGSLAYGRRYPNSTLLPDGQVLVTGGTNLPGNLKAGAVFVNEAWDPEGGQWSLRAAHKVQRMYHSTALLLPDGRVLAGGGGHPKGDDEGFFEDHPDVEVYSPPYLFRGDRPLMTSAPDNVDYGNTFTIATPSAAQVDKVVWMRLSSVTHAFNQEQRRVQLDITDRPPGELRVAAPSDPKLCPPGYYLMFLMSAKGVPSIARFIRVGPPAP